MKKGNKGITLIALVITIIVLLILAGVSIATLTGEHGILTQANKAKKDTEEAAEKENRDLEKLKEYLYDNIETEKKISELEGLEGKMTENTTVEDEYGNKIVIPKDFKVTNDTKKINEGIVIEDDNGNQFVWIPVGQVSNGTITKTINLSRYTFASDGTPTDQGTNYIGDFQELETSTRGNTTAKDLQGFIDSANNNGGYYLGRYEASNNGEKIESKYNATTWTNITQQNAAIAAREMYENNSSYTSDLVNSYAWDTAIIFIQSFGQNNYSRQTNLNPDVQLHINDMAGNINEWTTENYEYGSYFGTVRGGSYSSDRYNYNTSYYQLGLGFRPLLYIQS